LGVEGAGGQTGSRQGLWGTGAALAHSPGTGACARAGAGTHIAQTLTPSSTPPCHGEAQRDSPGSGEGAQPGRGHNFWGAVERGGQPGKQLKRADFFDCPVREPWKRSTDSIRHCKVFCLKLPKLPKCSQLQGAAREPARLRAGGRAAALLEMLWEPPPEDELWQAQGTALRSA